MVVFDLGGVLVHVAQRWRQAVERAALPTQTLQNLDVPLDHCPQFVDYQAGAVDQSAYLESLRGYLGLESELQALLAHDGILLRPTLGSLDFVRQLHAAGIRTGCLSNTNAAHWDVMSDSANFPAIAMLQVPGLSHVMRLEKPSLEIYRAYEALAGVEADEILFFDDLAPNVAGAREAGWDAVRIDPENGPVEQMKAACRERGLLSPVQ